MDTRLLPLPLTPFERHMLTDDRPDYPMTCATQLRFSGTVDGTAFAEAFAEVTPHHPLLHAVVDSGRSRRPCWLPAEGRPSIEWIDDADARGGLVPPMDLTARPGFRFLVRQQADELLATMIFHHACCDAIGAARFIEDVLTAYAARFNDANDGRAAPPTNGTGLLSRGDIPRVGSLSSRLAQEARTLLREGWHWLCHPVTSLGIPAEAAQTGAASDSLEHFPSHGFDERISARLRALARQRSATLNDLLLTAMFEMLDAWNNVHVPNPRTPWLRIAVPQNLRQDADRWMPAANKVTMSFLTRLQSDCRQFDALLVTIRDEMRSVRRWFRGKSLLRVLSTIQAVPGLARRVLDGNRCLATVVLSNVGDYDRWFCANLSREQQRVRAGGLRLEEVTCIPPIRPRTHAAFCAASYAGRLHVSLRHDPHCFTWNRAQELLSMYTARLEALAGEGN